MQHGHRLPHWVNARVGRRRFLRLAWAGLAGGAIAPLLAACQGGPDAVAVAMTADDRFDPGSLTVPVGTQVVWHNASTERHTATDDPATAQDQAHAELPQGARPWDSGPLYPGETWAHTFTTPGRYVYFCRYDEAAGMIATIIVEA